MTADLQNPIFTEGNPPRQEPQQTKQESTPEQRGTEQAPFIVRIQPTEQTQSKSGTDKSDRKDEGGDSWFSGWSLSDKIAALASAAAFLQFIALIATVSVMVGYGRRDLRAYILGHDGVIKPIDGPEGTISLSATVVLKNFGKTPASNYRQWVLIDVLGAKERPFDRIGVLAGGTIVAPTSEASISAEFGPVTNDDLRAIRNGEKRAYVWGAVEYVDAFKRKRHFRFYNWNGDGDGSLGWHLAPSDRPDEAN